MTIPIQLLFALCLACSFVYAGENLQGPYQITNDVGVVRVEENEANINCPVNIVVSGDSVEYVLDQFCVDGDQPNVRSVFFVKLRGVNYIGVIVFWYNKHRAEGIDETSYQVMVYKKNRDGRYVIDKDKNADAALYGTEDGAGDGSYKYNNALAVKHYLREKYR